MLGRQCKKKKIARFVTGTSKQYLQVSTIFSFLQPTCAQCRARDICKRAGAGAEEDLYGVDGALYNTGMCQCLDLHADVTFQRRARPPF